MNVEDTREAIKAAKSAFKEWANLTAKVLIYLTTIRNMFLFS
jgi:hypothetical protein